MLAKNTCQTYIKCIFHFRVNGNIKEKGIKKTKQQQQLTKCQRGKIKFYILFSEYQFLFYIQTINVTIKSFVFRERSKMRKYWSWLFTNDNIVLINLIFNILFQLQSWDWFLFHFYCTFFASILPLTQPLITRKTNFNFILSFLHPTTTESPTTFSKIQSQTLNLTTHRGSLLVSFSAIAVALTASLGHFFSPLPISLHTHLILSFHVLCSIGCALCKKVLIFLWLYKYAFNYINGGFYKK